MSRTNGDLWTMMPHGGFRVRVLVALISHQWFIRLRWIFVLATLLLLQVERFHDGGVDRPALMWMAAVALGVVNLAWTGIGRRLSRGLDADAERSDDALRRVVAFINAQMAVDIFVLTVLLRCSGGVENPMAIFYLFHTLIAALLLKPLNALLQGSWALAMFATLGLGECFGWITPHYPFVAAQAASATHTDVLSVLVSVGVLAAGIVGTLYFTLQISSRLDEQERELFETNVALRKSREDVIRLQEKRARFLRTAAHQLKTPLTGIEMLAGLIRDGVVAGDAVPSMVGRIIRRCQEAIVQVTELLTLERIERAAHEPRTIDGVEVRPALERLAARYRGQARAKGLTFESRISLNEGTAPPDEGGHAEVEADRTERSAGASAKGKRRRGERAVARGRIGVERRDFEDCVGNLLDNAIKYTREGGSVTLTASDLDGGLQLSVADTGIGIPDEAMDNLFEPFHRGNAALAEGIAGSGLGLTIVREVVQQARGRIDVRSPEGGGAEFVLWFPWAASQS